MYNKLKQHFNIVGVIDVEKYENYQNCEELKDIKSIFVVGLAYPHLVLKNKEGFVLGSIYTYGLDYHNIIKEKIQLALTGYEYKILIDNHKLDERKCLALTGLAYLAKNDLMINKELGSYFFIGLVLTKKRYNEVIVKNDDSCGSCDICLQACPVQALTNGFSISKCLSAENQRKQPLKELSIKKNYLILGCDICQLVCPKNKNLQINYIDEVMPRSTAYVEIDDLFDLSNKEFLNKYQNHAYLWRGKTLLLRNALTLLLRHKNTTYNNKIIETLKKDSLPQWYKEDAQKILKLLKSID